MVAALAAALALTFVLAFTAVLRNGCAATLALARVLAGTTMVAALAAALTFAIVMAFTDVLGLLLVIRASSERSAGVPEELGAGYHSRDSRSH